MTCQIWKIKHVPTHQPGIYIYMYHHHQYTRDGTMQMLAAQPQLHLHPSTCDTCESLNSAPC
jgi:hypothetical protein